MYIEDKACWLNHLDAVFEKRNRVHGTTKMTPFEASNNKLDPSNSNQTAKICFAL